LGGPTKSRWISATLMIVLWMMYIGLSSWNATVEKNNSSDLKPNNTEKWDKLTECAKIVREAYLERQEALK